MAHFFDIQPPQCRQPLEHKDLPQLTEVRKRVMYFDPAPVYERIADQLNPYARWQSISVRDMFPPTAGKVCDCGCGQPLTGRQTRWASDECSYFTNAVWAIISGYWNTISQYVHDYYGTKCLDCNNERSSHIEIDHVVGIAHGGGRGWLSNYRPVCRICHREKTNESFGWGREEKLRKQQMRLEL